jgi:hypothetical protein
MEDSLLERVTTAAEERQLSHNSLIAYRRTWLKIIAWAAAEGVVLETFPVERVGDFYDEATRGRSASHHLQVKAALALLSLILTSMLHQRWVNRHLLDSIAAFLGQSMSLKLLSINKEQP